MTAISIILPSLHPLACHRTLQNIRRATRRPYQVILVSPFRPPFGPDNPTGDIVWVKDESNQGAAYAQHLGAFRVEGEFVVAHADDFLYVDGWDDLVIPDFQEREVEFDGQYLMGLRYDLNNWVGTCFGMYYANFPLMRANNLQRYGWISPDYRKGFGDCDFSMRVWHRGGTVEFSREHVLQCLPEDGQRKTALCTNDDMSLFVSRWAPVFGQAWRTGSLVDFNINVDRGITHARTIKYQQPGFA